MKTKLNAGIDCLPSTSVGHSSLSSLSGRVKSHGVLATRLRTEMRPLFQATQLSAVTFTEYVIGRVKNHTSFHRFKARNVQ